MSTAVTSTHCAHSRSHTEPILWTGNLQTTLKVVDSVRWRTEIAELKMMDPKENCIIFSMIVDSIPAVT